MNRRPPSRRALALAVISCHATVVFLISACVKLPRRAQSPDTQTPVATKANSATQTIQPGSDCATSAKLCAGTRRVNINLATREELTKLPGIGEGLAARIVAHRERYGAFRRAEHLLMVRGIGERRFERLRELVTVE